MGWAVAGAWWGAGRVARQGVPFESVLADGVIYPAVLSGRPTVDSGLGADVDLGADVGQDVP